MKKDTNANKVRMPVVRDADAVLNAMAKEGHEVEGTAKCPVKEVKVVVTRGVELRRNGINRTSVKEEQACINASKAWDKGTGARGTTKTAYARRRDAIITAFDDPKLSAADLKRLFELAERKYNARVS